MVIAPNRITTTSSVGATRPDSCLRALHMPPLRSLAFFGNGGYKHAAPTELHMLRMAVVVLKQEPLDLSSI